MASLHSMGTFLLACCTGGTEGSNLIVYTPGMLPVVSNEWGKAFLSDIMSLHIFYRQMVLKCMVFSVFWDG